jgi:hypothetical protein
MVIVRTGRSCAPVFVPEGIRVRRPGWARARERGPFFHQKDREGPLPPPPAALAPTAGNVDCEEQLRSIVLRSHGSKDGKEIKPPRSPKRAAKVSTL